MRCSFALVAVAAVAVAFPQDASYVQPITQISDGQIQAPPATEVPVPSAPVESFPTYSEVVPTSVVETPVETPIYTPGPTGVPSGTGSPSVPSNGTISTGSPSATGGEEAPAPTGAAAVNMVSFGGIALAVAGFLFA